MHGKRTAGSQQGAFGVWSAVAGRAFASDSAEPVLTVPVGGAPAKGKSSAHAGPAGGEGWPDPTRPGPSIAEASRSQVSARRITALHGKRERALLDCGRDGP